MNGWYIALFLYWQWGVSGNIFVVSLFSPSTTRPPNFYPSIFVFTRPNDGWMGQHKAMVWWHQDGRNMCGIVAPGVEASFSTVWFVWVCAGTTILVSPSQQEGWILKWTKNHSQSDPQGTDVVIRSLQEVFEACNFPFLWMYPVIYICATKSMKTL